MAVQTSYANMILLSGQHISLGTSSEKAVQLGKPMSVWPSPASELEAIISHLSKSEDPVRSAYGESGRFGRNGPYG